MFLFIDLICLIFLYYYVFLLNDLLFLFNHLNSLEQIYKDNFKFYVFMIIGIFLFIILGLWSKSENYFHDFHQVSESILESKHDSKLIGYLIGVPFSTFLITSSFAISQQLFYSNFVLQGLLSLFFGFLNIFIAFYLSGYKKWIMITENNIILKSSFFKKNLENRIYDKKDFFLSLVNKKILLIQDEKYFLESSYILIKPNQIFKIDSNITIHGDLEKIQKFVNLFKDYNIPTQESLVKSIEKEFEFRELLKLQKEKDRRT